MSLHYSPAYIARIVATQKENPGWSYRQCQRHVGPDEQGREPSSHALRKWLVESGVIKIGTRASRHWSDEEKAEVLSMIDLGLEPATIECIIREKNGRAPSPCTIRNWMREQGLEVGNPGDSWQRSWDVAEGLEGAAWAHAVMLEWTPEPITSTTERDIVIIPIRGRRAA